MTHTMDSHPQVRTRSPLLTVVSIIALLTFLAVMVRRAAAPIKDPDAWWHLRVGSLFWDGTFTLTRTGPLSSFATEPWVPRDWLPQLVASKTEHWFGLPGVAWLYGASLVALLFVIYIVARRQADPLIAIFATTLGVVASYGSLTERPQMISFILLAIYTDAWLQSATDHRARWWLIPLTWIWASSHGLWYVGIALGIVVTVALAIERLIPVRNLLVLASIPILSLAAAGLTPAGPSLILAAFQTGDKWKFVSEWDPPDFTTLVPAAAMLMVCLIALTWARRRAAASWVTIGLLLLGTALILMALRSVTPGAIILIPLLASTLQTTVYDTLPEPLVRFEIGILVGAGIVGLASLALITPSTSSEPGAVPNDVNAQLDELPSASPILNAYGLGGWLHWRHPELETVIDGFTDGYTVEALEEYNAALRVEPGWEDYVAQTGAKVALLHEDSPLAFALSDRLGWIEVARDEGYTYLRIPDDQ